MPRKGENIYKRKDGRWEARYIKSRSESGKSCYGYVYAHSYHDVKEKLYLAKQTIRTVTVSATEKDRLSSSIHFKIITPKWLDSVKPKVKDSTYMKYVNIVNMYLLPYYKNTLLSEFNYASVEAFATYMLTSGGKEGRGLSSKTVSDTLVILKQILMFGEHLGYEIHSIDGGHINRQSNKELIILTRSEQNVLQQYIVTHMNFKNLGLLLCLFTGIRIGEVCALRWEDISLKEKYIYIHSTMQRLQCETGGPTKTRILISSPKSACSIRKIPIPDYLADIIRNSFPKPSGYVLSGREDQFVEPRSMQNHFKAVLRLCSIREVNFHALRHTFATRCIELGFDIKSLSEILGHASVTITMNRYVHPTMELKRENMNRLTDLFAVR